MSFMDKLKALFTGGSEHDRSHEGHDHAHEGHDHSHDDHSDEAMDDLPVAPAAPLDPLGTTMPEAGPIPTPLPPSAGEDDRSA